MSKFWTFLFYFYFSNKKNNHQINLFTHFFKYSKIVELEEELRVVGNNLKSLEVSEEKVISATKQILFFFFAFISFNF